MLCLILLSCGSAPQPVETGFNPTQPESTTAQIDELLRQAEASSGDDASAIRLEAADRFLAEGLPERAAATLTQIPRSNLLPDALRYRYATIQARVSNIQGDVEAAIRWLSGSLVAELEVNTIEAAEVLVLLGSLYAQQAQFAEAITSYAQATPFLQNVESSTVFDDTWEALQRIDDAQLDALAQSAESYELRGWIELERVYREDEHSIRAQLDSLSQWQRIWASHSASRRLPRALADLQSIWSTRPRHVALILPLQQPAGITIQEGFFSAYYEELSISREVPQVSVFDSSNVQTISGLYEEAIAEGVDLVIGPLSKQFVNELASRQQLPVPTLALNYADDTSAAPENLFQFGLAPEDDIEQLSTVAWQSGHRHAAVVTPQGADYLRLVELFSARWRERGGDIVSTTSFTDTTDYSDTIKRLVAIDSSENRAERLLQLLPRNNMEFTPRRRQDIDFIFLVANPRQGRLIKPTLAFYFAGNIPVYALPSIFDGASDPAENRDLDGILFSDSPWMLQSTDALKSSVDESLRQANGPSQRLRALGIDSFRLYARLDQFANGDILRMPGTTGVLSMNESQRIHREVSIARFQNGLAVLQAIGDVSSND